MSARRDYERLVVALHREIHAKRGDGEEADRLRDEMDGPWAMLTDEERAQLGLLSEDLYELGGERAAPALEEGTTLETILGQAKSALAHHPERTLALLRKVPDRSLPPDIRAYMLARCWDQLGFSYAAAIFFDRAYDLVPRANYAVMALSSLASAGDTGAVDRRIAAIEAVPDAQPALCLRAGALLFQGAEKAPEAERSSIFRRVITLVGRGTSGPDTLPSLRATALLAAGFSYQHLAQHDRALAAFDQAIAIHPHDSGFIARGLERLATDRPAALADFERAIELRAPLAWPYLYLAHDALMKGRYERVEALAGDALLRTKRASLRAELFEWSAIAAAQLGRRREVVRERFSSAIAEDPLNERIRRNAEAFEDAHVAPSAIPWHVVPPNDARARRAFGRSTAQTLARAA